MTWNRDTISSRKVRSGRDRYFDDEEALLAGFVREGVFRDVVAEIDALSPDHFIGRPRTHSHAVAALLYLCSTICGSQKRGEVFLRSPSRWQRYLKILREVFPDDPLLGPSVVPPTRSVLRHLRKKFDDELGERFARHMTAHAMIYAQSMDLGDNRGTLLQPSQNAVLYGDSVVIKPMSSFTADDYAVNPYTGERQQRRFDPDARTFVTGDKKVVYGNSFAHMSAFTGFAGEHITFDLRPVDKEGRYHESNVAIDMAAGVKNEMPGFGALAWDKALRGPHIDRVWNLRLQPMVGVYDKTGKSTETVPLGTYTVNGIQVRLVAWKGAACLLTGTGQRIELDPIKLELPVNAGGTVRAYCLYQIPENSECDVRLWGHTVRQRLNGDHAGKSSISEYVRAIPPGSDRWKKLYGTRSLAESFNAWIKSKLLPLQRARGLGRIRQWIDLIVLTMFRNFMSLQRFTQRTRANFAATGTVT